MSYSLNIQEHEWLNCFCVKENDPEERANELYMYYHFLYIISNRSEQRHTC